MILRGVDTHFLQFEDHIQRRLRGIVCQKEVGDFLFVEVSDEFGRAGDCCCASVEHSVHVNEIATFHSLFSNFGCCNSISASFGRGMEAKKRS